MDIFEQLIARPEQFLYLADTNHHDPALKGFLASEDLMRQLAAGNRRDLYIEVPGKFTWLFQGYVAGEITKDDVTGKFHPSLKGVVSSLADRAAMAKQHGIDVQFVDDDETKNPRAYAPEFHRPLTRSKDPVTHCLEDASRYKELNQALREKHDMYVLADDVAKQRERFERDKDYVSRLIDVAGDRRGTIIRGGLHGRNASPNSLISSLREKGKSVYSVGLYSDNNEMETRLKDSVKDANDLALPITRDYDANYNFVERRLIQPSAEAKKTQQEATGKESLKKYQDVCGLSN